MIHEISEVCRRVYLYIPLPEINASVFLFPLFHVENNKIENCPNYHFARKIQV